MSNDDILWTETFLQEEDFSHLAAETLGWREDTFEELCKKADYAVWLKNASVEELLAF